MTSSTKNKSAAASSGPAKPNNPNDPKDGIIAATITVVSKTGTAGIEQAIALAGFPALRPGDKITAHIQYQPSSTSAPAATDAALLEVAQLKQKILEQEKTIRDLHFEAAGQKASQGNNQNAFLESLMGSAFPEKYASQSAGFGSLPPATNAGGSIFAQPSGRQAWVPRPSRDFGVPAQLPDDVYASMFRDLVLE